MGSLRRAGQLFNLSRARKEAETGHIPALFRRRLMRMKNAFALRAIKPAYAPLTSTRGNCGTQSIWPLRSFIATIPTMPPVATMGAGLQAATLFIKDT